MNKQKGSAMIEVLVSLAILGVLAVTFLSGLATAAKTTVSNDERATAESLVRSQIEYIESSAYQPYPGAYPVNPMLTLPGGWQIPPSPVGLVHATDDGIQQVTVSAQRQGNTVLSMTIYKVNR
ncbi:MAG: hypothetical protein A2137_00680 [Chloroflexi bacterium RBG_16_58_8]|nr:MAG: hypothetical protein A2137_00680 [Chloroflexi bacterium RBG_16_58_8]